MCMVLLSKAGRVESAAIPCKHPAGEALQHFLRRVARRDPAGGIGQPEGSP